MPTHKRALGALAATAAGALAVTSLAVAPASAGNPNNAQKMAKAVSVDAVWDHLEAFQAIADEHGDRAAGTSGYEASGAYVESQLQAAGYETERQYFSFIYEETLAESLTEISPTARDFDNHIMSYSGNTPEGGVTAELVAPSTATGCDASEWEGVDATGKIALISRGVCAFSAKSLAAAEAGALGAIVYNNAAGDLNGTLGGPNPDFLPTTGILQADGQALLAEMAEGPVVVNLDLRTFSEERETFNVFAETAQGRDDNVVMMGAHLDSVQGGPGVNDNGTGSAAILETAIQLADVKKLNNQVRFAWWGAEEAGLLGSWHYVDDLVENNPAELDKIATYLNFDMVGSPNYMIGVYDADQSTYEAPVPVPDGSIETEKVLTDWFDSVGQPWVDTLYSGRSDYQPFILNGVPASGLFTGADGVKTAEQVELFGGEEGVIYDPNYHTPEDTIDNVDKGALDIMTDAVAAAAITLANDTSAVNGERSAGKSGNPHPAGPLPMGDEDAA
ncbi:MAG TPA: M20/M25/M40 family metallo-hydrolase [Nocardioidaceae bacterium]